MLLLAPDRLRLEVTDSGLTERRPAMASSAAPDWFENERHRGLFLVSALALAWGHRPVLDHPALNLGLTVWADFTLDPAAIPSGLPPFVHAG
ncbi:hypothetical protein ACFO4E_24160 [Nocardiopsis mangrovi]|uniref:Uncharacterized protein n=1 Tax=Nocardiopsis mangrovi TaxID=1179818 RepID=A0ABV9E3R1_9ACTN